MINVLKRRRIVWLCLAAIVLSGLGVLLSHPLRQQLRISTETGLARLYSAPSQAFPTIDQTGLLPVQQRIVRLTRQEYAKKPVSFDANVRKYSAGAQEPWCANFASWVWQQAGQPMKNPHSDNWRIPGVFTLREYFQSIRQFQMARGYTPKTGDLAIYLEHGRQHTNIVLKVDGSQMTTVGGNEGGHLRLNTQPFSFGSQGLTGFGRL